MASRTAPMPSASLSMPASKAEASPGFGVYVHWPFCQSKCPYCDFNSHVVASVDQARWARALKRELQTMRVMTGPEPLRSIFFGGGTPSLMQPDTVAAVIDEITALWPTEPDLEITLEANPTSVEATHFRGYQAAGVNRLSLGVQSLNDAELKFLGRRHTADEALAAIALARESFPRLSFDLIYARPGQNPDDWQAELRKALSHAVDHLSLYQLTIEQGTAFARLYENGAFILPDDEAAVALYEMTGAICAEFGLNAYEVSNYAKPGAECRHNLIYWHYGDYAGVGPGAHGRVVKNGRRLATATHKAPGLWIESVERDGHGLEVCEEVSASSQADEMMLMGLRLMEGVSLARFARLAGHALSDERLLSAERHGLVTREGDRLVATAQGRLVLNSLLGMLLS